MEPPFTAHDSSIADGCHRHWTLVVAVSLNGVIGRGDTLPWKLRSDLQRFKRMTMGHCLLMGRKTYDSIGRSLPGRQTLVLSRKKVTDTLPGKVSDTLLVNDLQQVDARVEPGRQVMVVGGAQVYRSTIDFCSTIWLTRVLADIEGDTFFPTIDWNQWQLQSCEPCPAGEADQWPTEFQIWTRRGPTS